MNNTNIEISPQGDGVYKVYNCEWLPLTGEQKQEIKNTILENGGTKVVFKEFSSEFSKELNKTLNGTYELGASKMDVSDVAYELNEWRLDEMRVIFNYWSREQLLKGKIHTERKKKDWQNRKEIIKGLMAEKYGFLFKVNYPNE